MERDGPNPEYKSPFELAQETLDDIHHALAEYLVIEGDIKDYRDGDEFRRPEDQATFFFNKSIPLQAAQQIFFRGNDIIATEATMDYVTPHRLGSPPNDSELSRVSIVVRGRLNKDTYVSYGYDVWQFENNTYAQVGVEYTQNGRVVGRDRDITIDEQSTDDDVERRDLAFFRSLEEESRDMTLDDIENIHTLLAYLKSQPPAIEKTQ